MNLLAPSNLLWFVVIPITISILAFAHRKRLAKLRILAAHINTPQTLFPRIITTSLILILLCTALLRPYSGFTDVVRNSSGRDNLLLIDISDSMRAKDVSPSRIEVAKRKSLDLMSLLKAEELGHRLGIVLFAGQAYLYCPPTADFGALKQFIDNISPDLITAQGSGINAALTTVLSVIERTKMKEPQLYIFSDGEDAGFKLTEASSLLMSANLKPFILGIGTTAGGPIDIPGLGFVKDSSGKIVITRLNEETLKNLAKETAGLYAQATIGTADLKTFIASANPSQRSSEENNTRTVRIYDEFGHLFIWAALILVLVSIGLRKIMPIFVVMIVMGLQNSAEASPPNAYEAWKLYNQGNYKEAAEGFTHALKNDPQSLDIMQALGSSLYKLERYDEAGKLFSRLATESKTKQQAFDGNFNLGNSYLKSKNYEKAIRSYEEALKVEPESSSAKFNLELAKKLLEEKKEEEKNKQQNNEQQKQDKNQESEKNEDNNSSNENQNNGDPTQNQPENQNAQEQNQDKEENKSASNNDQAEQKPQDQSTEDSSDLTDSQQEQSEQKSTTMQESKASISESEAQRWLDSLPDAPILIQKKNDRQKVTNGQTW